MAAEPQNPLPPEHPVAFQQQAARRAARLQSWLLGLGALLLVVGPLFFLLPLPWAHADDVAVALTVSGAVLLLVGLWWARHWRRRRQKAWWGQKYGKWT
jgi:hypothetical protein